ncbi:QueT transporter family protein [Streptococcus sp. E24BD]|uniref:QueT transporter family protein n=1 Tax=Streptococcus sp. E24BD TaxID=3278715 RepID=UPI00359DCF6B
MKKLTVTDYTHMAIVAAIYVVLTITPPFNAISYGPYQFRISEMMNFLTFFHRKYIIAVTAGVVISNLFTYGLIDVVVGGLSTLVFVALGVMLFKKYQNERVLGGLFNKAFFYFSLFFAASMFTIAAELTIIAGAPFFLTWVTTGLGELASLLIGSLLIEHLSQRFDLTK